MSHKDIVFSPLAQKRLEELADYLYQQQLSEKFVLEYLAQFERWLENILGLFPESGRLMPEFGKNVRRVVYKEYSFVCRIQEDEIHYTLYTEKTGHGLRKI